MRGDTMIRVPCLAPRVVVAAALAWAVSAFGPVASVASAQDAPSAGQPGDLRAFEDTLARYRERVAEMERHALSVLQGTKASQLAELQAGYDAQIRKLEARQREDRKQAISKFESFLESYDSVGFSSDVRLRLAELYFQESKDTWLEASAAYEAATAAAGTSLDAMEALSASEPPELDLSPVSKLLTRIVEDNRGLPAAEQYPLLDVAFYMLAFVYSDENSNMYDRDRARAVLRDLVVTRPASEYADAAHLLLGLYAFEDNRFDLSVPEFQAVIDRGPEFRWYSTAVYQRAWAHYKLNQYDEALGLFAQLLDESAAAVAQGGRESNFAAEASAYVALSLGDRAMLDRVTPLEEAKRYFSGLKGGSRTWEWGVLQKLAEAQVRYQYYPEAVELFQYLQTRPDFALRAENPEFQSMVVKLLTFGYGADLAAAGQARIEMSERYGEGSAWWRANQNDPEALAKALKFNEESLLYVAAELKVRAQEAEMAGKLDPALFASAAEKYREYLDKFPISDNFYENQLQLADALFKGQRLAEAAIEWESLVKTAKSHDYDGLAAVMSFRTWDQLLRDQVGPPEKAYAGAQVERTYTSVGGVEMKVMALEEVQKRFIASADRLLQMDLGPESAGFDAASYVDSERVKIMYLPAQVLYYAGRYDEARPRLEAIIRDHATEDEAAWAANLLLNTYINEQDNPQIRVWSREFANRKLGASADVTATSALRFQDTLERATFDAAYQAAQRGDLAAASSGYLSFIEEFPKSANRPIAMLNAADTLERSGKADEANGVYERFIKEYPTRDEARPIFFAIASNYESIFELDKAIKIYQELLDRFPTYERAPDAAYMVAFLKEGTGDKLGAAQGYEKYGRTYTAASDREEVFFRAGRLYEAVDRDRAISFYKSYLSQFALTQVDHAIEAQARIADLHKAAGRAREAGAALDELEALFDRAVAAGKTPSLASQDRVAEAAFRALQAHHDKIVASKLSRDDKKDGDLLNVKLPAELDALAAEVQAFSNKYASFWGITGAYYLYGAAEMHYARLGLALEPPAGLSEEDRDVFWQLLEEQLFPKYREREANAVKSWQAVLDLAGRFHRHSVWIDRSNEALNQFDPKQFPAGKRTLPGDMQTVTPIALPAVLASEVPGGAAAPGAKPAGGE